MIADGDDGQRVDDAWEGRVALGRSAGRRYAFRPGRVLVSRRAWDRLLDDDDRARLRDKLGGAEESDVGLRTTVVLEGIEDTQAAVALLRAEGLDARVDHVFFAVPATQSVSGAPVMFGGVHGSPVMFGGVGGAPVMFGGVHGSPVMFGGVGGAPVMFGGVQGGPMMYGSGGCCCDSGDQGPAELVPPRRSTVRRADPPPPATRPAPAGCRVAVVDTGFADAAFRPAGLAVDHVSGILDQPDGNDDTHLDVAAGHATFIAGIVKRMAPDAKVETWQVLSTFGDASDSEVAAVLQKLAAEDPPPEIVNLSFAGYSDDDTTPPAIAASLAELRAKGVVVIAAAGNDGTCRPAWPAATDGVVSVAALDDDGPAWFTNHGSWVRACAPGVDVLSRFFEEQPDAADHPADVEALARLADDAEGPALAANGWALWSGTSFSAPIVAGVVARAVLAGHHPVDAVTAVVDDPSLLRLRGLGTVVNERPW